MLRDQPDLYLSMGDNIYVYKSDAKSLAETYAQQAQIPEFKKYRALVPILATWDDNDYGANDGGGDHPEKNVSKLAFLKFFPHDAKLIADNQNGIYHSVVLGDGAKTVQIIFLDTRYFRDSLEKQQNPKHPLDIYKPTADKAKTFLGEEQWKWLKTELQKRARFRVLVSSVQLIHNFHSFEKWGNFPHERERLFGLLRKTKAKNLVVISGDRHQGEIHRLKIPGYGDLYDVTASGINKTTTLKEEPAATRLGDFYKKENYGLIALDWDKATATVSIKDMSGHIVQSIDIKIR
jgi:alkaline phosphatase D